MLHCYIQHLEQHKDGWHIRFSGSSDDFWTMLSNFKREQKLSGQVYCYYDPRFFGGKGGWFCIETILEKYASNFSNYTSMRSQAEHHYKESGQAETDRRAKEAKEAEQKERETRFRADWQKWQSRQDSQEEKQRQREKDWEQTQQRQKEEQRHERRSRSSFSASLIITEALEELGLAPLTPVTTLTEKQVKAAFRAKALKAHPDTGGSNSAFIRLNQAYQLVLMQVQRVGVR